VPLFDAGLEFFEASATSSPLPNAFKNGNPLSQFSNGQGRNRYAVLLQWKIILAVKDLRPCRYVVGPRTDCEPLRTGFFSDAAAEPKTVPAENFKACSRDWPVAVKGDSAKRETEADMHL
jgi:hypothetical protein